MTTRVTGYDRIDPRTGKRVHVDPYSRFGGRHGFFALNPREWEVGPAVPTPAAVMRARLDTKRHSLLGGVVPDQNTSGWQLRQGRRGDWFLGMTDEKYGAWLQNTLRKAREALDKQGTTARKYRTVNGGQSYTKARRAQQERVISPFLEKAKTVPKEHKAVLTGGRPGAGKSSSLADQRITEQRYFSIDSDKVKEEMIVQGLGPDIPGLTPFEASGLMHEESADIADEIQNRLAAQGTNLVVDGTMGSASEPWVKEHIDNLHALGYTLKGLFVEVSPQTSKRRALDRHRRGVERFLASGNGVGGRFVDPDFATRDSKNREVFERLKQMFEAWAVYDNDKDDRPPVLIESSHDEVQFARADARDSDYYLAMVAGGVA